MRNFRNRTILFYFSFHFSIHFRELLSLHIIIRCYYVIMKFSLFSAVTILLIWMPPTIPFLIIYGIQKYSSF